MSDGSRNSETATSGASWRPASDAARSHGDDRATAIERIAVAVDVRGEDCGAAYLAVVIADVTGAEMMLVAVDTAPKVALPPKLDQTAMRERAEMVLRDLRDFMVPRARTMIETDRSVPRALVRVAKREQQDLIIVGSSRRAPDGRVRIGRRMRQLPGEAPCAVGVAPRGLCARPNLRLTTIGVGYDGRPEAREAVRTAVALAHAARARLRVRAVLDDWLPYAGPRWMMPVGRPELQEIWDEVIEPEVRSLREDTERVASATGAEASVEVTPGSPPEELIALSAEVDLLVIGSRRPGASAQVLLRTTGAELMHGACCPVIIAPRPSTTIASRESHRLRDGRSPTEGSSSQRERGT